MVVTDAQLLGALRAALEPMPQVVAALLFGSRARGSARDDSDVDVAILLRAAPRDEGRYRVVRELLDAFYGHVSSEQLDLVLLNDAPPALAFQVLKHGTMVVCRDDVAMHRFRVRTYRVHADYEPVERLFRRVTRERAQREAAQREAAQREAGHG